MRCPPPWEMVLVVESDTDLGKMLAGDNEQMLRFLSLPLALLSGKHSSLQYCHLAPKGNTKTSPLRLAYKSLDLLPISSLNYQGVSSASWGAHPPGPLR